MDREPPKPLLITLAAALLLAGVIVTALMLLKRDVRLHDELSGPARDERLTWPDMRIDLNTASSEELLMLPGVGPAFAERIVAFRRERGRIESLDDLLDVPGMGEVRLEAIAPHVVIEPQK